MQGLRVTFCKVWSSFSNQRPFLATQEVPSSPRCRAAVLSYPLSTGMNPSAHAGSGGDQAGKTRDAAACLLPSPRAMGTSRICGGLCLQQAWCRVVWSVLVLTGDFFWPVAWVLLLARLRAVGPSSVPGGTEAVPWPHSSRGTLHPAG